MEIGEEQVIACAKELLKNTSILQDILEELIRNGDCMEEEDIYRVVEKICEDGFDITGFGLEEIPHPCVYVFSKGKGTDIRMFDVYLDHFHGGEEDVTVGYVGDDGCTHDAKSIKEAIYRMDVWISEMDEQHGDLKVPERR